WLVSLAGTKLVDCVGRHVCLCAQIDQADMFIFKLPPTTNVGISGWGRVFGDDVAASAIADRVCHHCHLVKITGRSYRLKDLPRDGPVEP
ncbi:ATP-binding protein, partial [Collinsella sp. HCP28S3_E5]|uniref:ATP-binding protein n=1 Tax=Collinsella sp. HCP28S3_E5 TaxID=3438922 RepID=UPI003F8C6690